MTEQILALKNFYENKIDKELFFKLLLHLTDGHKEPMSPYANYLDIENWKKLFSLPSKKIIVTSDQLAIFFEYMTKYHGEYVGVTQEKYYVRKELMNNELRTEKNFRLEATVLTTIETILN